MLIPKKDRLAVYQYLFKEGVLYAKKDFNLAKHPELDVRNLYVIKLLQSLEAKELVKEIYAWRHFYWYLNDDGIEYLREYLSLPPEIVPATLKKQVRAAPEVSGRDEGRGRSRDGGFGGRDGYRGGEGKASAPGDFNPEYRGSGFGRGASMQR